MTSGSGIEPHPPEKSPSPVCNSSVIIAVTYDVCDQVKVDREVKLLQLRTEESACKRPESIHLAGDCLLLSARLRRNTKDKKRTGKNLLTEQQSTEERKRTTSQLKKKRVPTGLDTFFHLRRFSENEKNNFLFCKFEVRFICAAISVTIAALHSNLFWQTGRFCFSFPLRANSEYKPEWKLISGLVVWNEGLILPEHVSFP
ncbi:hypothetical protein F2P81_015886 [Scophthalmus maximus]|uniref:Uncharacterized protein n=1 Tax=Scophthalmus maximus TaxID=52904 RepID=A0A6A4SJP0_SCOMX|nr:hypothetical protein F2P81_015886 [Scophthalmus maximus]